MTGSNRTVATALAKTQAELIRSQAGRRTALQSVKLKATASLDRLRNRLRESKAAERGMMATTMAVGGMGGVVAGQLAKVSLFPNAEGVSRAPWVSYGAGAAALAMVLTGKARTKGAMAFVALSTGMVAGQLAIKSYQDWDLWPFDNDEP
jgi:hypothetical protein